MPLGEQLAPHFARQRDRSGAAPARAGAARSTRACSASRSRTLRRQLAELRGRNVEDGAVVVLDNASGEVLAWVGSSGDLSGAARGRRRARAAPAGLDAEALRLRARVRAAADHAGDAARRFAGADRDRRAASTCRRTTTATSRAWSARAPRSAPASTCRRCASARCSAPMRCSRGSTRSASRCRESGGCYGASLALGSADVTLLALTNAYRTLANGGRHRAGRAAPSAGGARRRASPMPAAAFLVTDILADNNARARTFGLASPLATRGFAAVKTGTSKDMRDNWCVGFTDRYTVGVWVGNASGAAMHDVSGVSGAAPVWQALAAPPARGRAVAARRRRRPASSRSAIAFDAQREPARDECFLAGSERRAAARQRARSRGASASASPARATAASSRSIPTFRRRRSASPSKASAARGVLDGQRARRRRAAALGAVAGAASPRARRRVGADAAERRLRGARRRRQEARDQRPGSRLHAKTDHTQLMRIVLIDVRVGAWRPRSTTCPPCPGRTSGFPTGAAYDRLTPLQRRALVGAIVAAHGAASGALLQVREVREAVAEAAPMFVSLIAPPTPPKPRRRRRRRRRRSRRRTTPPPPRRDRRGADARRRRRSSRRRRREPSRAERRAGRRRCAPSSRRPRRRRRRRAEDHSRRRRCSTSSRPRSSTRACRSAPARPAA